MTLDNMAPLPSISVVVVVFGGPLYMPRCLGALLNQIGVEDVEIVVPCDDRFPDIGAFQKQFPAVRFVKANGIRTYAEMRALGVQQTRGRIVALTEDHCIPSPEWCAEILRAHTMPHAAIGGVVDKTPPDTVVNWAMYLADYGRYMSPASEGPANLLTDCNVSYKQSALEAIAGVWRNEFHEPAVHGALQTRGEPLWLSPRIVVHQQRSLSIGDTIRDRYSFGRLFGSGRIAEAKTLHRLTYAGCAILLPPLLVGRIAGHVIQKRRCVGPFVRALPVLLLLSSIWALGECVGYVTGRPDASLRPGGPGGPGAQSAQGATA